MIVDSRAWCGDSCDLDGGLVSWLIVSISTFARVLIRAWSLSNWHGLRQLRLTLQFLSLATRVQSCQPALFFSFIQSRSHGHERIPVFFKKDVSTIKMNITIKCCPLILRGASTFQFTEVAHVVSKDVYAKLNSTFILIKNNGTSYFDGKKCFFYFERENIAKKFFAKTENAYNAEIVCQKVHISIQWSQGYPFCYVQERHRYSLWGKSNTRILQKCWLPVPSLRERLWYLKPCIIWAQKISSSQPFALLHFRLLIDHASKTVRLHQ